MRLKILFYSDCFIFGGSENVLVNLLNNVVVSSKYKVSYVFRYTKEYERKVKEKINTNIDISSVRIFENNTILYKLQLNKINKPLFYFVKILLKICELTGVYWLYTIIRLYFIFKIKEPDILFINNGGYPGAYSCRAAVIAASLCGIKHIIMNVNNMAEKPGPIESILIKL